MRRARSVLLVAVIAFAAALAGMFAGRGLMGVHHVQPVSELHRLLYDELDLNPGQMTRLKALEAQFMARKAVLDDEMKADNAELAKAIAAEHGYGPRVEAAVDRSHHAMGELQKETLEHVFAMRAVLTPQEAARYDAAVARALTAPPK